MIVRPRVYFLKIEDPERSIDDPGLGALAAAGWTVAGSATVGRAGPNGEEVELMLMLWPPPLRSRPAVLMAVCFAVALLGQTFGIGFGYLLFGLL